MTTSGLLVQRVLPVAVLVLSAVAAPAMIFSPAGLPRLRHLREEKARVDEEVSKLGHEIRRLRVEVRRAKADPAAVERVARDELGLVRQTELVLQFAE